MSTVDVHNVATLWMRLLVNARFPMVNCAASEWGDLKSADRKVNNTLTCRFS